MTTLCITLCITLYIFGAATSAWAVADDDLPSPMRVFAVLFWPIFTSAIIAFVIFMAIGARQKSRKVQP